MADPRATKKAKADPSEPEPDFNPQHEKLEKIQSEIEKLNDEATDEILLVEKKFNGLRKPYYKQRNDVIREIPEFWLRAFMNHQMLSTLLDEADQDVFKHLKELNVEDFDDVKSGFKVTFTFDANPYFKNKVLFKEFRYNQEGQLTVTPSKIEWQAGKDLTQNPSPSTELGKRQHDNDLMTSFFNWFNPEDQDLDLGETIKEELWPNPAKYYHGEDLLGGDEEEAEEEEGEEVEEEVDEEGEEGEGEDGGDDDDE